MEKKSKIYCEKGKILSMIPFVFKKRMPISLYIHKHFEMCIRNSQYWLQLGNLGGINGEENVVDSFFLLDNFFSV